MEEMDSNETLALMGRTIGKRRSPSAPALRPGQTLESRFGGAHRNLNDPSSVGAGGYRKEKSMSDTDEPMEYSLAELRSMSEMELEQTMRQAGVPSEDIDHALNDVVEMDASVETIAADQRRNKLVALFINSGRVKLVRHEFKKDRRSTLPLFTNSNVSAMEFHSSAMSFDGASVKSSTSSKTKKSKLQKIIELQTENAQVKRENKSLKKTVKKLLGQLTDMAQKEVLEAKNREREEEKKLKDANDGFHSIGEGDAAGNEKETLSTNEIKRNHVVPLAESLQSTDNNTEESNSNETESQSKSPERAKSSQRHSDLSEITSPTIESKIDGKKRNFANLTRKLQKEKEAHQNTDFRLKVGRYCRFYSFFCSVVKFCCFQ